MQELDAKFDQYEKSIDPDERKKLAEEVQRGILENYYLVPVFRHAFVNAIGPTYRGQSAGRISSRRSPQAMPIPGKTSSCGKVALGDSMSVAVKERHKDAAVYRSAYPV